MYEALYFRRERKRCVNSTFATVENKERSITEDISDIEDFDESPEAQNADKYGLLAIIATIFTGINVEPLHFVKLIEKGKWKCSF